MRRMQIILKMLEIFYYGKILLKIFKNIKQLIKIFSRKYRKLRKVLRKILKIQNDFFLKINAKLVGKNCLKLNRKLH